MKIHWWTSGCRSQPQGGARPLEAQMVKHSPHKRYKGHCALCGHYKGNYGNSWHMTWQEMKAAGLKRRFHKRKLYGED
jgi:hypothetical protein